jgi:hypothetical protein
MSVASAVVHQEINPEGVTEGWERVSHFSAVRKLEKTPFPADFEPLVRSKVSGEQDLLG